ncbi:lipopolysaccharide biosynthesis protein [Nocardia sp. NPDC004260]
MLGDIALVSFGRYGQYIVTVVTVPLIARVLGANGLGLLAIGMSAYFIGSLVVDLGVTQFLSARVPEINARKDTRLREINQLRGDYLAIRLTTATLFGVALAVASAVRVPEAAQMVLLGLFVGGFWSLSEDWLLIGEGRFGTSTAYQTIGRLCYLGLLVGLLPQLPNSHIALLCLLLSSVPTVALTWWDAWRRYGSPTRPRYYGVVLRRSVPVFVSRLLVTGYGQGAATLYSTVLDAVSLGLYSAGDRLVRAVQSLLDAIGFALLPRMARRGDDRGFWRHSLQALAVTVAVAALASVGIWLAAPLLIRLVFGTEFAASTGLLRIEVLILPATTVTSFITTAILPVRQDTTGVLIGALLGTLVAAGALVLTVRTRSVHTLVYGLLVAEITVASWHLLRVRFLTRRDRAEADTVPLPIVPRKEIRT